MSLNKKITDCLENNGWVIGLLKENPETEKSETIHLSRPIYKEGYATKHFPAIIDFDGTDTGFVHAFQKKAEEFSVNKLVSDLIQGVYENKEKPEKTNWEAVVDVGQTFKAIYMQTAKELSELTLVSQYAIRVEEKVASTIIVDAESLDQALGKVSGAIDSGNLIIHKWDDLADRQILPAKRISENGIVPEGMDVSGFIHLNDKEGVSEQRFIYKVYKRCLGHDCWGRMEYHKEYYQSFEKVEDAERCRNGLKYGGEIVKEILQ